MYNNDTARLVSKDVEILKKEETTYNFEVEDFHTYYVGENYILVHNACSGGTTTKTDNYSDEFLEWLNKGDNNNSVYNCFDDAGNDVYTGITKQKLKTRLYQHKHGGKNFSSIDELYGNLTRNKARSIETAIIRAKPKTNIRLSIAENSKYFDDAMRWAKAFIGG